MIKLRMYFQRCGVARRMEKIRIIKVVIEYPLTIVSILEMELIADIP